MNEYTIGQQVIDISSSTVGTVVGISSDKYTISVEFPEPDVGSIIVSKYQYEIVPLFSTGSQ